MALLVDVLASAVGEAPTPESARAAALDARFGLGDRLLTSYGEMGPPPVRAKDPGEFRPAWLLDYQDGVSHTYGREFFFAGRAILYAHRLAVVDPLHYLDSDVLLDGERLAQAVEKIALYGPWERAGLLFYLPPLTRRVDYWSSQHIAEDVAVSFDEFLREQRITVRSSPGAAAGFLRLYLGEIDALLRACEERRDRIDLFLPGWFPFRAFLSWLADSPYAAPVATSPNPGLGPLTNLLAVPTLSREGYSALSTRDLLLIRESGVFEEWRSALAAELTTVALSSSTDPDSRGAGGVELRRALGSHADRVSRNLMRRNPFGEAMALRGSLTLGVVGSAAAGFAFSGHDAAVAAATGTAGGIATALPGFAKAVRVWLRVPETKAALDRHFRVFASDD